MNKNKKMNKQGAEKTNKQKINRPELNIKEIGGPSGPEPTRFGDWEKNGRCSDF
jgi:hypothetical protein